MSKEVYYIIGLVAGLAVTIQSGINAQLNILTKSPVISTLISFVTGTALLIIITLLFHTKSVKTLPLPDTENWWKFTGGLLGVVYVLSVVIIFPKLGAATTLSLIVAGQLVFALVFDHFGWFGFPVKTISLGRIAGIGLIILGVWLVRKF